MATDLFSRHFLVCCHVPVLTNHLLGKARTMFLTLHGFLSPLLIATIPLASAAFLQVPEPGNITIASISAEGGGCPPGIGISTSLSPDRATITFGFDEFHPYIGPGISPADKSKTCNIALTLSHPRGYSFEIVGAVYHGFARLDVDLTGTLRSSYTIVGDGVGKGTSQTNATVVGELVGSYTHGASIPTGSRFASPCGTDETRVQIATRATLSSRSSSTSGGWDDEPPFSLTVQQIYLEWSACEE